jgi:hypothetical protein
MRLIRITYDPEGDILYLAFGQPTAATGYQLSGQLLLRVDPHTLLPMARALHSVPCSATPGHKTTASLAPAGRVIDEWLRISVGAPLPDRRGVWNGRGDLG